LKTPPATPYLLPSDNAVSDLPWTTEDGKPVPARLEHWDPFTDAEFVRTMELDADLIRQACQLGPDATFALTVSWYSSRTRLGAEGTVIELGTLGGLVRASLSLQVPGAAAGGRLDIRTRLVLRHAGADPSPISPRREGAVLWSHETRIALEGASSRFPITALDFTALVGLPDTGAWAVEWNPEDLEAPVLGGLRLIINSSDEILVGALRSGSSDSRSSVIRSFVMFDVARSLVYGALESTRFVADPESFEEGSIGRMLFELLTVCWPGTPVATLSARSQDDPARLETELQAHLRVLR
jgi:hypothetical protein